MNIYDFFTKFGFGDGDQLQMAQAETLRPKIVAAVNAELSRCGLPWQAVEHDPGTVHNSCRIHLVQLTNEELWDFSFGNERPELDAVIDAVAAQLHS